MASDWHDSLKVLAESLPDAPAAPESPTAAPASPWAGQGRLDIYVERKGRGGKTATIITGFTVADDTVADIAARLKKRLGAGGSVRGGEILIQGDRSAAVRDALAALGLKSRLCNV